MRHVKLLGFFLALTAAHPATLSFACANQASQIMPTAQAPPTAEVLIVPSTTLDFTAPNTVSIWADVLEQHPDPKVVTDADLLNRITETKLPWRVKDKATGIELLLIPPGKFVMGMSSGDMQAIEDEKPAHEVTLTKPFYLGRTEVTQAQWVKVMKSNPSFFQPLSDRAAMQKIIVREFNFIAKTLRTKLKNEAFAASNQMIQAYFYNMFDTYFYTFSNSTKTMNPLRKKFPNEGQDDAPIWSVSGMLPVYRSQSLTRLLDQAVDLEAKAIIEVLPVFLDSENFQDPQAVEWWRHRIPSKVQSISDVESRNKFIQGMMKLLYAHYLKSGYEKYLAQSKAQEIVNLFPRFVNMGLTQSEAYAMALDQSESVETLPIENVSWKDCHAFCERASFRLPSEAEWEYACRAGATAPRYGEVEQIAWQASNSAVQNHRNKLGFQGQANVTQPVGVKAANALGVYDMLGNVWEWCEDRYAFDYYKTCANGEVDPLGPDPIETFPCVMRGGYWFSGTGGCRASSRTSGAVTNRGSSIGFRVARNP